MERMKDLLIQEEEGNEGMPNYDIDYEYEYWIDSVLSNKHYFKEFNRAIKDLRQLNKLIVDDENLQQVLLRQIYIGAIGTLEVFLADCFINITIDKPKYLKQFVQTNPELKNRKFEIQDIYQVYDKIIQITKEVMYDTIYHNLSKVREMFRTTFSMKFPDISEALKAVHKRHDLVHRNGKGKSGEKITITANEVSQTISMIELLVENIKKELQNANVDFSTHED